MRTPCSRSKARCGVRGRAGNSASVRDELALDVGRDQAAACVEAIEVCRASWRKACQLRAAQHCGGIVRGQPRGVRKRCAGELPQVCDGAIHCQHRSGQRVRAAFEITGKHCAAVRDIDIKLTELVSAVGHSSGGHRIRHENGAFNTLGPEPKPHELRRNMDAVADQLGIEALVVQRDAENARLAMIERAHRVEGMRGAAGAGINRLRAPRDASALVWPSEQRTPRLVA